MSRARIAKRARPPLRPAPIEKPFADATATFRSFSGAAARRRERRRGGGAVGEVGSSGVLVSLWKPLVSGGSDRQAPPGSSADGDMVAAAWWFSGELMNRRKDDEIMKLFLS